MNEAELRRDICRRHRLDESFAERLHGSTQAELEADAAAIASLRPRGDDELSSFAEVATRGWQEFELQRANQPILEALEAKRLGNTLAYLASPAGKRERDVALLSSIGIGAEAKAEQQHDPDRPDFDGGARETAPPTNPDLEADHNQAIVELLQQARQDRYGA
jgi:hypothetical protein